MVRGAGTRKVALGRSGGGCVTTRYLFPGSFAVTHFTIMYDMFRGLTFGNVPPQMFPGHPVLAFLFGFIGYNDVSPSVYVCLLHLHCLFWLPLRVS